MAFRLRSQGQKLLEDEVFTAKLGFSLGLLPTQKEVIEGMIYHLISLPGRRQLSRSEAAAVVAEGLIDHWILQNIYTIQKVHVTKKITKLYEEYSALLNTSKQRRTPAWKDNKLSPFLTKLSSCFDIFCKDPEALKKLEVLHGVKMSKVDYDFLADQQGPRLMFCTTEVDKNWAKTAERRNREEERLRRQQEKEKLDREERERTAEVPELDDNQLREDMADESGNDDEYSPTEEQEQTGKKRKFVDSESGTCLHPGII